MSQVARVFVVLNLLVAAGFLFTASTFLALNADYKNQLADEKKAHADTKAEAQTAKQQLEQQLAEAEAVRVAARERAATYEAENGRLTQTNKSLSDQIATKDTQISGLNDNLGKLEETSRRNTEFVTRLTAEKEKAFEEARTARSGEKEAREMLAKEQETNRGLRNDLASTERSLEGSKQKVKDLELMVDFARSKGVSFGKLVMMKRVNGAVTAADNGLKIAMINIGKTQGVERGYVFDVVRGSDFIGQLEVDEVYDNAASCTIKLTAGNAMVKPADIVTTTLN